MNMTWFNSNILDLNENSFIYNTLNQKQYYRKKTNKS